MKESFMERKIPNFAFLIFFCLLCFIARPAHAARATGSQCGLSTLDGDLIGKKGCEWECNACECTLIGLGEGHCDVHEETHCTDWSLTSGDEATCGGSPLMAPKIQTPIKEFLRPDVTK